MSDYFPVRQRKEDPEETSRWEADKVDRAVPDPDVEDSDEHDEHDERGRA